MDQNHLSGQKSPYLLQHLNNPVDWHPWGDAAFDLARLSDRPVLLSIGYAACHWCHVMERESFADPEVGEELNRRFVCVKVDREERPDVDAVYLRACQLMTGSGGWPLTLLLTPDRKPFFAATYLPRHSRNGMIGLLDLAERAADLWQTERARLTEAAERICTVLDPRSGTADEPLPEDAERLHAAVDDLHASFDPVWGGFGADRKFPSAPRLLLLLVHSRSSRSATSLRIASRTLGAMRRGGLYDHLGGGYHRYCVDRQWQVPHFEKMLYDQALISLAHLEAHRATGLEWHAAAARSTLGYLLRDLSAPQGGFCAAEDADSDGREGAFYLWTADRIEAILGSEASRRFFAAFDVRPEGNAAGHGLPDRSNVLRLRGMEDHDPDDSPAVRQDLAPLLDTLYDSRRSRPRPLRDDKVLTDWNGLAIAALARAGRQLEEPGLTAAAADAARFVLRHLTAPDGRLLHRYRDGEAAIDGMLEDHAFLAWGLIELHQSDPARFPIWLETALDLTRRLDLLFHDDRGGGYRQTRPAGGSLPFRPLEFHDGALPSGNGVAALNLVRLSLLTGDRSLADRAGRIISAAGPGLMRAPADHATILLALDLLLSPPAVVTISGDPADPAMSELAGVAARSGLRDRLIQYGPARPDRSAEASVCHEGRCLPPVPDPTALSRLLEG